MGHPNTLVSCSVFVRGEIDIARLFVIAIHLAYLIVALVHLSQQLTVQSIEVKMHKTVTVAGHEDMFVGKADAVDGVVLDISRHLVLDGQRTQRSQRIGHIDAQAVLMTV